MLATGDVRSKSQPNLNDQDPEITDMLRRKRTKSEPLAGLTGVFQIEAILEKPVTQEKIDQAKRIFETYFPDEMKCSNGSELGKSYEKWQSMVSGANFRLSALKTINAAQRALNQTKSDFQI